MQMIYGIHDKPKTLKELLLYALQQLLSVIVATILIANVCGTPVDSCMFGACIGTLVYQGITNFSSPMFISSCGATCSAVIGALAIGNGSNYLAVAFGGLTVFAVYAAFALLVRKKGIEAFQKLFPPYVIGAVTIVIGLNLAAFIPTYTLVNGNHSDTAIMIAILTMLVTTLTSIYGKKFAKTIPFLIGLAVGYIATLAIYLCGAKELMDFSAFEGIRLFALPDFSFLHFSDCSLNIADIGRVVVMFLPVSVCALLEHYSDHKVLSNIIGTDLTENPGLHKTLIGDGLASFVGTVVCGLPNTSYGEAIATTGFSKVASVRVITTAAIMLGLLSFFQPIQAFFRTIPSFVFGGCAMILYGYISASGLKTIISSHADLENTKTLIVTSVILTVGVSGIYLFDASFAGVSLAMVLGVILNLILKCNQ